jgi:hypothetical protein
MPLRDGAVSPTDLSRLNSVPMAAAGPLSKPGVAKGPGSGKYSAVVSMPRGLQERPRFSLMGVPIQVVVQVSGSPLPF